MPKVAIDIAKGRKKLDLFYVRISRVKRIKNIMFEESFDYERLIGTGGKTAINR